MDSLELNRTIAYRGDIGKQREEFCIRYIRRKQALIRRIQQEIFRQIEGRGEEITCHKGCSVCCVLYIEANIQECEAIVYYLYQNPDALFLFLQQYQEWRNRMRQSGDPFRICENALYESREGKQTRNGEALLDALLLYQELNIPCPFLHDGICMIYEVRPYVCANHYVTTPSVWCSAREWCRPLNPNQPKVYKTSTDEEISDLSFYCQRLVKPVIRFMPATVYEIINGSFMYLSTVTGIKGLADE